MLLLDLSPLNRPQLKIVSALASNFAVIWLAALFATKEVLPLLTNIFLAILAVSLAYDAERHLDETYD